jgi:hypothetical protein
MARLKRSYGIFLILICIATGIYTSACKNKCGTTTCQNGGTCVTGKCSCPTGYSGNSCQTAWDGSMIGTYTCSRGSCNELVTGNGNWNSAVTAASTNGGYTINISNFNGSAATVATASVDSFNNIRLIPTGNATGSSGISGTGTYYSSTNSIKLHFVTVDSGSGTTGLSCDINMVKE